MDIEPSILLNDIKLSDDIFIIDPSGKKEVKMFDNTDIEVFWFCIMLLCVVIMAMVYWCTASS